MMVKLIEEKPETSGLYHLSSDPISKYDLLSLYKDLFEVNVDIEPFGDFKIDRSLDSSRFRAETGFRIPEWPKLIEAMRADPTPYDILRAVGSQGLSA